MATGIGGIPAFSPDLVDPTNRGPEILRTSAVMMSLAVVAVGARLTARRLVHLRLASSDYMLIFALITSMSFSALVIVATRHGLGRHVLTLTFEDGTLLLQILYAEAILYTLTMTATKLSILLLYRTIFPIPSSRILRYTAYFTASLCVLWGVAILLVGIFSCTPIWSYWDIWAVHPNCINQRSWYLGGGAINVITDTLILALPVASVWRLSLSWRQKLSVSGLFMLGGFVVVAAIVRLVILLAIEPPDSSWTYYGVAIWSVIELNVAVISACLPTLRPLLVFIAPRLVDIGGSIKTSLARISPSSIENRRRSRLHGRSNKEYPFMNPADGSETGDAQLPMQSGVYSAQRFMRSMPGVHPSMTAAPTLTVEGLQGMPCNEIKVQSTVRSEVRQVGGKASHEKIGCVVPAPGKILVTRDFGTTWSEESDTLPDTCSGHARRTSDYRRDAEPDSPGRRSKGMQRPF